MNVHQEIAKFLKLEFERAKMKNPSFSLRSLARKTDLSASALSEVMNGKRRLTPASAKKLFDGINLNPITAKNLISQIGPLSRGKAQKKLNKTKRLVLAPKEIAIEMDQFHVIADWYYLAVHALCETHHFKNDPEWIAARLGVKPAEASLAVSRLLRCGYLVKNKKNELRTSDQFITTTADVAAVAIRKHHLQSMEIAATALKEVPVAERDFSSIQIASSPAKLEEAKTRIETFRRDLREFLKDVPANEKTEVFKMNIQLFPITKKESKK